MKVSIVPEKAAKERSSEIVAYCLQVLQFKCQLVEEKAALFDVGFDQEASFLVKLVGQMPEFSDRYDWSGLRLGNVPADSTLLLCPVLGVRWLGTSEAGALSKHG